jgi:hypothetical protein
MSYCDYVAEYFVPSIIENLLTLLLLSLPVSWSYFPKVTGGQWKNTTAFWLHSHPAFQGTLDPLFSLNFSPKKSLIVVVHACGPKKPTGYIKPALDSTEAHGLSFPSGTPISSQPQTTWFYFRDGPCN